MALRGFRVPAWLRPSRSVPITRWRSDSRWSLKPAPLAVLAGGQFLFGTGEAFMVAAGIGVSPWTVLAQGIASRTGLAIGAATFAVSLAVLLLWIPLRERPGLGTIANAVIIAGALQLMIMVLPRPTVFVQELLMALAGIALIGIGSGFYLTSNLGPGPRDGWMTGIHLRTGWPVAAVRLGIEATVLVIGWLLGGTVGLGTVLFALLIGPSVAYGLRIAGAVGGSRGKVSDDEFPELDA